MYPTVPDHIAGSNYGRTQGFYFSGACLHLIGDIVNRAQKIDIARQLIGLGKWAWDVAQHADFVSKSADGGHWIFQQYPVLVYLLASGRSAELSRITDVIPGNVLAQPFIWTPELLATLEPHDDPTSPATSRRRQVLSVEGNTITLQRHEAGESDKSSSLIGLFARRLSDGAQAAVVTPAITGGNFVVTLDAQPSPPFVQGDEVTFIADYAPQSGDPGWVIKGLQEFAYYTPSSKATYLIQQNFENWVLFARAMGVWDPSWDATEALCVWGRRPDFPTARNDYSPLYGDGSSMVNFCKGVWDRYASSLVPALMS